MAEGIYSAVQIRFGLSAQQTKEGLLELRRDPPGSISDLAVEIGHLVKHAHPYLHIAKPDLFTIEYLIHSLGNKALQKHLLPTPPQKRAQCSLSKGIWQLTILVGQLVTPPETQWAMTTWRKRLACCLHNPHFSADQTRLD